MCDTRLTCLPELQALDQFHRKRDVLLGFEGAPQNSTANLGQLVLVFWQYFAEDGQRKVFGDFPIIDDDFLTGDMRKINATNWGIA